ncbi:MAG: SDR family oxidoreductase, partial [Bryobacteraceae bacterium]
RGGGGGADPRPNFSAYATAKTAVVRFAETIAEQVPEHNININLLSPGGSYTHMTDQILSAGSNAGRKESEEALQIRITGGITPEKQIELALFLASEDSNHISGKLVHVTDDWRRLEQAKVSREIYTLRRTKS